MWEELEEIKNKVESFKCKKEYKELLISHRGIGYFDNGKSIELYTMAFADTVNNRIVLDEIFDGAPESVEKSVETHEKIHLCYDPMFRDGIITLFGGAGLDNGMLINTLSYMINDEPLAAALPWVTEFTIDALKKEGKLPDKKIR